MRVTLVSNELRGFYPAGGMGTAMTFLALAVARMGHSVQILLSWQAQRPIDPYWERAYADAGIRVVRVPGSNERIEPGHFSVLRNVELALRADPPDAVVTHDLSAPAYSALRLRHLGLAFTDVLFVVFCHGTRGWITEMSARVAVPDAASVLAESVLEQACVELADVVVSPSSYLAGWMREQGWQLPERTAVIPYFTRSGATGEPAPPRPPRDSGNDVKRFAFFGRFEDKKGMGLYLAALNRLDVELLRGIEVEFIGKTTKTWTVDRIEASLSAETRGALARLSFETNLEQHEALERLARPGTVAVMPSLGDNSPNTVYECLEHGIPFIASTAGGIPELAAPEDRGRVLFEPTPEGIESALRRVLSDQGVRPARPAFDGRESYDRWIEVLATRPKQPRAPSGEPAIDVIVVRRTGGLPRARPHALDRQTYRRFEVIESEGSSAEQARASGLRAGTAPYVLFLDEDDVLDDDLLTILARAQQSSGADAVTCAMRAADGTVHFFSGEPRGLGALSNDYGTVALLRRDALAELTTPWPAEADPDWPLLAGLAATGANVVSVPLPLVTQRRVPGSIAQSPSDALIVIERLERAAPGQLRLVGRLAAGLAAVTAEPANRATARMPSARFGRVLKGGIARIWHLLKRVGAGRRRLSIRGTR